MEETPAVPKDVSISPAIAQSDGGRPPPSPLSGGYLLIVISEPYTDAHKAVILQKLAKAFLSWNVTESGIDIERELAIVTALSPEGDFAKNGERLIQNASEHLITEILIHPQINTMRQCIRNLLSSFTKYRFIIHAGYVFCGNGSWILQDGTFSMSDFIDAFQEIEVQRVIRAYEKTVRIDICCISEGSWNQARIGQEPFSKLCHVEINPSDKIAPGNVAVREFVDYLEQYIIPSGIEDLLEPSDIVGNIRFSHPTLYVFPGGEGDAALFGINGFNMLVDGGFNRKACFWNFVRHLDRLDAVLLTRVNNSNIGGMSGIVQRKVYSHVYPQIGHFFSNLQGRKSLPSPDGDKDKDPLLINLIEEGDRMVLNLKQLQLKPHHCYRDASSDPLNLYHKVGHGKLDMYVISPSKDSREVKEFLSRWNNHDVKLFSGTSKTGNRELRVPLQNLVSICALLVWQPANPDDSITRILFPGSTPQHKIFEGFERLKQLEFLKHSTCTMKSISPVQAPLVSKPIKKITSKIEKSEKIIDELTKADLKSGLFGENEIDSGPQSLPILPVTKISPRKAKRKPTEKAVMKDIKSKTEQKETKHEKTTDTEKSEITKTEIAKETVEKKKIERKVQRPIVSKPKPAPPSDKKFELEKSVPSDKKSELEKSAQSDKKSVPEKSTQSDKKVEIEKSTINKKTESEKSSPTTPKKINGEIKPSDLKPLDKTVKDIISTKEHTVTSTTTTVTKTVSRPAPRTRTPPKVFPAKSLKDENNRKVAEAKQIRPTPPKTVPPKPAKKEEEPVVKAEKKPIVKRPKLPTAPPVAAKPTKPSSPVKVVRKPFSIITKKSDDKKLKADTEKTDSSAVSTPSTLEADTTLLKGKAKPEPAAKTDTTKSTAVKKIRPKPKSDGALKPSEESAVKPDTTTYVSNIITKQGDDEEDEILIIETTEMKKVSKDEYAEQKYLRDEKESEKKKPVISKPSDEKKQLDLKSLEPAKIESDKTTARLTPEDKQKIFGEVQGIITTATKLVATSAVKETPEKLHDKHEKPEIKPKDIVHASEEKLSAFESSSTTAPTMPEDEKIDEIKEIEEKYDKEETKEKSVENGQKKIEAQIILKKESPEDVILKSKKDIVKTPDEVADLPMHEEVDIHDYDTDSKEARSPETQFAGITEEPVIEVVKPEHPEYVTITPTSSPDEKPMVDLKQQKTATDSTKQPSPVEKTSKVQEIIKTEDQHADGFVNIDLHDKADQTAKSSKDESDKAKQLLETSPDDKSPEREFVLTSISLTKDDVDKEKATVASRRESKEIPSPAEQTDTEQEIHLETKVSKKLSLAEDSKIHIEKSSKELSGEKIAATDLTRKASLNAEGKLKQESDRKESLKEFSLDTKITDESQKMSSKIDKESPEDRSIDSTRKDSFKGFSKEISKPDQKLSEKDISPESDKKSQEKTPDESIRKESLKTFSKDIPTLDKKHEDVEKSPERTQDESAKNESVKEPYDGTTKLDQKITEKEILPKTGRKSPEESGRKESLTEFPEVTSKLDQKIPDDQSKELSTKITQKSFRSSKEIPDEDLKQDHKTTDISQKTDEKSSDQISRKESLKESDQKIPDDQSKEPSWKTGEKSPEKSVDKFSRKESMTESPKQMSLKEDEQSPEKSPYQSSRKQSLKELQDEMTKLDKNISEPDTKIDPKLEEEFARKDSLKGFQDDTLKPSQKITDTSPKPNEKQAEKPAEKPADLSCRKESLKEFPKEKSQPSQKILETNILPKTEEQLTEKSVELSSRKESLTEFLEETSKPSQKISDKDTSPKTDQKSQEKSIDQSTRKQSLKVLPEETSKADQSKEPLIKTDHSPESTIKNSLKTSPSLEDEPTPEGTKTPKSLDQSPSPDEHKLGRKQSVTFKDHDLEIIPPEDFSTEQFTICKPRKRSVTDENFLDDDDRFVSSPKSDELSADKEPIPAQKPDEILNLKDILVEENIQELKIDHIASLVADKIPPPIPETSEETLEMEKVPSPKDKETTPSSPKDTPAFIKEKPSLATDISIKKVFTETSQDEISSKIDQIRKQSLTLSKELKEQTSPKIKTLTIINSAHGTTIAQQDSANDASQTEPLKDSTSPKSEPSPISSEKESVQVAFSKDGEKLTEGSKQPSTLETNTSPVTEKGKVSNLKLTDASKDQAEAKADESMVTTEKDFSTITSKKLATAIESSEQSSVPDKTSPSIASPKSPKDVPTAFKESTLSKEPTIDITKIDSKAPISQEKGTMKSPIEEKESADKLISLEKGKIDKSEKSPEKKLSDEVESVTTSPLEKSPEKKSSEKDQSLDISPKKKSDSKITPDQETEKLSPSQANDTGKPEIKSLDKDSKLEKDLHLPSTVQLEKEKDEELKEELKESTSERTKKLDEEKPLTLEQEILKAQENKKFAKESRKGPLSPAESVEDEAEGKTLLSLEQEKSTLKDASLKAKPSEKLKFDEPEDSFKQKSDSLSQISLSPVSPSTGKEKSPSSKEQEKPKTLEKESTISPKSPTEEVQPKKIEPKSSTETEQKEASSPKQEKLSNKILDLGSTTQISMLKEEKSRTLEKESSVDPKSQLEKAQTEKIESVTDPKSSTGIEQQKTPSLEQEKSKLIGKDELISDLKSSHEKSDSKISSAPLEDKASPDQLKPKPQEQEISKVLEQDGTNEESFPKLDSKKSVSSPQKDGSPLAKSPSAEKTLLKEIPKQDEPKSPEKDAPLSPEKSKSSFMEESSNEPITSPKEQEKSKTPEKDSTISSKSQTEKAEVQKIESVTDLKTSTEREQKKVSPPEQEKSKSTEKYEPVSDSKATYEKSESKTTVSPQTDKHLIDQSIPSEQEKPIKELISKTDSSKSIPAAEGPLKERWSPEKSTAPLGIKEPKSPEEKCEILTKPAASPSDEKSKSPEKSQADKVGLDDEKSLHKQSSEQQKSPTIKSDEPDKAKESLPSFEDKPKSILPPKDKSPTAQLTLKSPKSPDEGKETEPESKPSVESKQTSLKKELEDKKSPETQALSASDDKLKIDSKISPDSEKFSQPASISSPSIESSQSSEQKTVEEVCKLDKSPKDDKVTKDITGVIPKPESKTSPTSESSILSDSRKSSMDTFAWETSPTKITEQKLISKTEPKEDTIKSGDVLTSEMSSAITFSSNVLEPKDESSLDSQKPSLDVSSVNATTRQVSIESPTTRKFSVDSSDMRKTSISTGGSRKTSVDVNSTHKTEMAESFSTVKIEDLSSPIEQEIADVGIRKDSIADTRKESLIIDSRKSSITSESRRDSVHLLEPSPTKPSSGDTSVSKKDNEQTEKVEPSSPSKPDDSSSATKRESISAEKVSCESSDKSPIQKESFAASPPKSPTDLKQKTSSESRKGSIIFESIVTPNTQKEKAKKVEDLRKDSFDKSTKDSSEEHPTKEPLVTSPKKLDDSAFESRKDSIASESHKSSIISELPDQVSTEPRKDSIRSESRKSSIVSESQENTTPDHFTIRKDSIDTFPTKSVKTEILIDRKDSVPTESPTLDHKADPFSSSTGPEEATPNKEQSKVDDSPSKSLESDPSAPKQSPSSSKSDSRSSPEVSPSKSFKSGSLESKKSPSSSKPDSRSSTEVSPSKTTLQIDDKSSKETSYDVTSPKESLHSRKESIVLDTKRGSLIFETHDSTESIAGSVADGDFDSKSLRESIDITGIPGIPIDMDKDSLGGSPSKKMESDLTSFNLGNDSLSNSKTSSISTKAVAEETIESRKSSIISDSRHSSIALETSKGSFDSSVMTETSTVSQEASSSIEKSMEEAGSKKESTVSETKRDNIGPVDTLSHDTSPIKSPKDSLIEKSTENAGSRKSSSVSDIKRDSITSSVGTSSKEDEAGSRKASIISDSKRDSITSSVEEPSHDISPLTITKEETVVVAEMRKSSIIDSRKSSIVFEPDKDSDIVLTAKTEISSSKEEISSIPKDLSKSISPFSLSVTESHTTTGTKDIISTTSTKISLESGKTSLISDSIQGILAEHSEDAVELDPSLSQTETSAAKKTPEGLSESRKPSLISDSRKSSIVSDLAKDTVDTSPTKPSSASISEKVASSTGYTDSRKSSLKLHFEEIPPHKQLTEEVVDSRKSSIASDSRKGSLVLDLGKALSEAAPIMKMTTELSLDKQIFDDSSDSCKASIIASLDEQIIEDGIRSRKESIVSDSKKTSFITESQIPTDSVDELIQQPSIKSIEFEKTNSRKESIVSDVGDAITETLTLTKSVIETPPSSMETITAKEEVVHIKKAFDNLTDSRKSSISDSRHGSVVADTITDIKTSEVAKTSMKPSSPESRKASLLSDSRKSSIISEPTKEISLAKQTIEGVISSTETTLRKESISDPGKIRSDSIIEQVTTTKSTPDKTMTVSTSLSDGHVTTSSATTVSEDILTQSRKTSLVSKTSPPPDVDSATKITPASPLSKIDATSTQFSTETSSFDSLSSTSTASTVKQQSVDSIISKSSIDESLPKTRERQNDSITSEVKKDAQGKPSDSFSTTESVSQRPETPPETYSTFSALHAIQDTIASATSAIFGRKPSTDTTNATPHPSKENLHKTDTDVDLSASHKSSISDSKRSSIDTHFDDPAAKSTKKGSIQESGTSSRKISFDGQSKHTTDPLIEGEIIAEKLSSKISTDVIDKKISTSNSSSESTQSKFDVDESPEGKKLSTHQLGISTLEACDIDLSHRSPSPDFHSQRSPTYTFATIGEDSYREVIHSETARPDLGLVTTETITKSVPQRSTAEFSKDFLESTTTRTTTTTTTKSEPGQGGGPEKTVTKTEVVTTSAPHTTFEEGQAESTSYTTSSTTKSQPDHVSGSETTVTKTEVFTTGEPTIDASQYHTFEGGQSESTTYTTTTTTKSESDHTGGSEKIVTKTEVFSSGDPSFDLSRYGTLEGGRSESTTYTTTTITKSEPDHAVGSQNIVTRTISSDDPSSDILRYRTSEGGQSESTTRTTITTTKSEPDHAGGSEKIVTKTEVITSSDPSFDASQHRTFEGGQSERTTYTTTTITTSEPDHAVGLENIVTRTISSDDPSSDILRYRTSEGSQSESTTRTTITTTKSEPDHAGGSEKIVTRTETITNSDPSLDASRHRTFEGGQAAGSENIVTRTISSDDPSSDILRYRTSEGSQSESTTRTTATTTKSEPDHAGGSEKIVTKTKVITSSDPSFDASQHQTFEGGQSERTTYTTTTITTSEPDYAAGSENIVTRTISSDDPSSDILQYRTTEGGLSESTTRTTITTTKSEPDHAVESEKIVTNTEAVTGGDPSIDLPRYRTNKDVQSESTTYTTATSTMSEPHHPGGSENIVRKTEVISGDDQSVDLSRYHTFESSQQPKDMPHSDAHSTIEYQTITKYVIVPSSDGQSHIKYTTEVIPTSVREISQAEYEKLRDCGESYVTYQTTEHSSTKPESKSYDSPVPRSLSETDESHSTDRITSIKHETVTKSSSESKIQTIPSPDSGSLHIDPNQMCVKFHNDSKKDQKKSVMLKSSSDETYETSRTSDTVTDLSIKFDKKDTVSKTVSLPILDEHFEEPVKAASELEGDDISKSLPFLEKISYSESITPTNLSDPALTKQVDSELQSKSVSLPVIKRPDDSEKYMTLPHLYKTHNLEDLTADDVAVEEKSEQSTSNHKDTIDPIKETDESIEEEDTDLIKNVVETTTKITTHLTSFLDTQRPHTPSSDRESDEGRPMSPHSDASTEQYSRITQHSDDRQDSQLYESDEENAGSTFSTSSNIGHLKEDGEIQDQLASLQEEAMRKMSASMTQSFYGTYPDDDEPLPENVSHSSTQPEQHSEQSQSEPKQDPIRDWGKPLGLPNIRDINRMLIWNPLQEWGKPLGLPSPAPPNQDRESNGDIEINLTPINAKGTPKNAAKKPPPEKSNAAREPSKTRDSSTKRTKLVKSIAPVYVDLAYVPHHGNPYYSNVEYFKRIRARYYVFSGTDPSKDVFNALIEAKKTWEDQNLEVTVIPTYDTDVLGYWITENEETLSNLRIDLSPSASRCTINLQDHDTSCSAYRLEF